MKQLFIFCIVSGCLGVSLGQGLQGKVKIMGNVAVSTGHSVSLSWATSQNATSYNIYRGTIHGGPYTKVISGVATTTYTDGSVSHGQTLYYVATAVSAGKESAYSQETKVVIP
jgi:fibronectin type 3 domain-containing protein